MQFFDQEKVLNVSNLVLIPIEKINQFIWYIFEYIIATEELKNQVHFTFDRDAGSVVDVRLKAPFVVIKVVVVVDVVVIVFLPFFT